MTALDLFTFFGTDLIQSEDRWKLFLTSDWLMSARKNVSSLHRKVGHTFGLLAVNVPFDNTVILCNSNNLQKILLKN